MSELDKKILENQAALLGAMGESEKKLYLVFMEGMLAGKGLEAPAQAG